MVRAQTSQDAFRVQRERTVFHRRSIVTDCRCMEDDHRGRPLAMLHITGRSDHGGGPEHIFQIIRIEQNMVRHHIACPDQGIYWRRYQELVGTRMLSIPARRISIRAFFNLLAFCQSNHIRLIHSHGTCAGLYGRMAGILLRIPSIHTFHGLSEQAGLRPGLIRQVEAVMSHFTTHAIAVSPGEYLLASHRWPCYRTRMSVIKNGLDLQGYSGRSSTFPGIVQTVRIISFTRMNEQKNPMLALAIAKHLHDAGIAFHLELYGEGIASGKLQQEVLTRGLTGSVVCHPPIDSPENAMDGCQIYLSTSRWEGLPMALLEAWRGGLLVVASDVVGNQDVIVDHENGRLYPSEDAEAAAQIIIEAIADPDATRRMIDAAHIRLRLEYNSERMVKSLTDIYATVIDGGS